MMSKVYEKYEFQDPWDRGSPAMVAILIIQIKMCKFHDPWGQGFLC